MQNFAFTLSHSPFGPAYLNLIKEKVEEVKDGLFIIAVDPWAVSSLTRQEAAPENFRENKSFTSKINLVNVSPNYEYILRFYDEPLYHVFERKHRTMKLHKNGWLEVNVPVDSSVVAARIHTKVKDYKKYAEHGALSALRIQALKETIEFLKTHGEVYLVRLPVAKEMSDIENKYAPSFDTLAQRIANEYNIHYLNYFMESGEFLTTDGNHLYKEAGRAVSRRVAKDIARIMQMANSKM